MERGFIAAQGTSAGIALAHAPYHADRCLHPLMRAWIPNLPLQFDRGAATVDRLDCERERAQQHDGIVRPRICAQNASLLADGLHYETRIAKRNILATRPGNPHDAFNAMVWLRHPRLKWALNARQVADIDRVGPKQRTRGQCALTQFDEAGAIVWLADPALLPLWDAHDWRALFVRECSGWGARIALTVFGHALLEQVRNGYLLPSAKALVVTVSDAALAASPIEAGSIIRSWPSAETGLADAIADGRLLLDPQELRPLPLAGIPGWHADYTDPTFHGQAPCFRALRAGRCYPPPAKLHAE